MNVSLPKEVHALFQELKISPNSVPSPSDKSIEIFKRFSQGVCEFSFPLNHMLDRQIRQLQIHCSNLEAIMQSGQATKGLKYFSIGLLVAYLAFGFFVCKTKNSSAILNTIAFSPLPIGQTFIFQNCLMRDSQIIKEEQGHISQITSEIRKNHSKLQMCFSLLEQANTPSKIADEVEKLKQELSQLQYQYPCWGHEKEKKDRDEEISSLQEACKQLKELIAFYKS